MGFNSGLKGLTSHRNNNIANVPPHNSLWSVSFESEPILHRSRQLEYNRTMVGTVGKPATVYTLMPTLRTYNSSQILIRSTYIQTRSGGGHHYHHQGRRQRRPNNIAIRRCLSCHAHMEYFATPPTQSWLCHKNSGVFVPWNCLPCLWW